MKCLGLLLFALMAVGCNAPEPAPAVTLETGFDAGEAMEMVNYISDRWRVRGGGNAGYNETLDYIAQYLRDAGFEDAGTMEIMEVPLTLHPLAWDPVSASLSVVSPEERTLHTYAETPTILGRLSGSTPDGGVTARLVNVGLGEDESDYEGLDVAGAIVLGRGRATRLYEQAVVRRGALGVLSDRLRLEEFHELYPDMVLNVRLPFTTPDQMQARDTWALTISTRNADYLRSLAEAGPVRVHAEVKTSFFEATQRNLIAEIPGATHPEERIVLYAHIDNNKPGANNNATGDTAHSQLARILAQMIRYGGLPRPDRTITFLFGSEHEFARQWLERQNPGSVVAMLNADMTGANTALTQGVYRLERAPDPTMDLPRPERYRAPQDERSGWGFRPLPVSPYPGHYLSDFAESLMKEQSEATGWAVRPSPFEGGSDHDEFLTARIPSVLSWFWEDHFISTNMDTPDKVSAESIQRVQELHGRIALGLASAREEDALAVLDLVASRAAARMALELETSRRVLLDTAGSTSAEFQTAQAEQIVLLGRWGLWYDQAMAAVASMPVDPASATLLSRIRDVRTEASQALSQAKLALRRPVASSN
jgi:aminopeptidase YwaD